MTFPSGVEGRGSATLIAKDYLLTAGHCVYDEEEGGLATKATLYFGRNGLDILKKVEAEKLIVHPEFIKNDENYDFALIKLSENIGEQLGWASISVAEDLDLKKKNVNVTGYPATKGVLGTLFNKTSYHMYSMNGPIVSVKKHKIYYHIDTSGGQSGAGVWILNDGIVECLAIHTTGKLPREEGNGAVRINEENFNIITGWMNDNKE